MMGVFTKFYVSLPCMLPPSLQKAEFSEGVLQGKVEQLEKKVSGTCKYGHFWSPLKGRYPNLGSEIGLLIKRFQGVQVVAIILNAMIYP